MTDDCIYRDDAVSRISELLVSELHMKRCPTWNEVYNAIGELPSADVIPVVHSRWIETTDGAECEKCGREAVYQIVDDHWEYEPWCPHCGAIMDNKRGNENG